MAFDFGMDYAMPKVAYLNLTDMHAMIGFWSVASSILVVLAVHRLVVGGRPERALRVQKTCRWLFPTAYLAVVLVNLLVALAGGPPASGADQPSPEASTKAVGQAEVE